MEIEDSLPCSHDPRTGTYPEPDASTPHLQEQDLFDVLRLKGKVSTCHP